MTCPSNWQASFTEQRSAWGIACISIVLILIASTQPQWFDFSAPIPPATQAKIEPQQPLPPTHIITPVKPSLSHLPAKKTPTIKPVIKPVIKKISPKHAKTVAKTAIAAGYYVQLGAFEERVRAQRLVNRLAKKGWSIKLVNKKDGLYGVWIGPKATHKQVEKLLHTIQKTLKYKGFIIQQPA